MESWTGKETRSRSFQTNIDFGRIGKPVPNAYRTSYNLHICKISVRSMPSTMHIPLQAPKCLLQLSSVNRSSLLRTSSGRMIRRARPSLREADKFTKLPAQPDLQSPFLSLSYRTPNIFSSPARIYIHSFKHPHSENPPLSRPGPPCISFPTRVTALPTRFSSPVRRNTRIPMQSIGHGTGGEAVHPRK